MEDDSGRWQGLDAQVLEPNHNDSIFLGFYCYLHAPLSRCPLLVVLLFHNF
jgi:hypothetical protein